MMSSVLLTGDAGAINFDSNGKKGGLNLLCCCSNTEEELRQERSLKPIQKPLKNYGQNQINQKRQLSYTPVEKPWKWTHEIVAKYTSVDFLRRTQVWNGKGVKSEFSMSSIECAMIDQKAQQEIGNKYNAVFYQGMKQA